ncbi:MFS transporter [Vandammella animalimorsus]|uniref:MFS transporter n=2 Tax=Vandammella animalimorsus TaxID=2029117 RepID=A0A2A2T6E7_9BURK|nr:MFS transporter [Vandammella animalimorsus]PAX17158.1 MFS transporter [Vandammella animalimorsus]PAX19131.1 MFS transporter [Vandammella animalimorsus]
MQQVLLCGALVVTLSMGVRHGFGLWQLPIVTDMGWLRQDFSNALAIQNLAWGFFGIFIGMVADRLGALRVLLAGAGCYAAGLLGMAYASTPWMFALFAGMLLGLAQACTTYAVVYGVIGRQIPMEKRSWAMGVTAAAGSFGQFLMLPLEGWLITQLGWQQALLVLAVAVLGIAPLALGLREPGFRRRGPAQPALVPAAQGEPQTVAQALREALSLRSFQLLTLGYFVCGFQVVFIGVHMPSYLKDLSMPVHVATYSLALIGLFNVFGSYLSGWLGQSMPRRHILAFIYFARSVVISVFLLAPLSSASVYLFSAVMGLLWLSTVPPTNATVAQIFGVRHLSMLGGVVFFSHQVGSFMGVWLGGYLYDRTGSYDIVWYIAIALGVVAGLINLVVDERPVARPLQAAPAGA